MFPFAIGSGTPLFGDLERPQALRPQAVRPQGNTTFPSGVIELIYERIPRG